MATKADRLFRHVGIALALALVLYAVAFRVIEHRRVRQGPWQVEFMLNNAGQPTLRIDQHRLGITDVTISVAAPEPLDSVESTPIEFADPRPTPFEVPFGECVFMDPTFLPGTLVLDIYGHQIQLLPRTLTIDGREIAWKSGAVHQLEAASQGPQREPARVP